MTQLREIIQIVGSVGQGRGHGGERGQEQGCRSRIAGPPSFSRQVSPESRVSQLGAGLLPTPCKPGEPGPVYVCSFPPC